MLPPRQEVELGHALRIIGGCLSNRGFMPWMRGFGTARISNLGTIPLRGHAFLTLDFFRWRL